MNRARPLTVSVLVAALIAGAQPSIAAESPFEGQLVRLAEVLGSLHYLRNLCGEDSGTWRDRMQALLEAENPDEARRARLVASFNRGYRSYEGTYSNCTESAIEAIDRFVREGEALSRDTASRFGNQ